MSRAATCGPPATSRARWRPTATKSRSREDRAEIIRTDAQITTTLESSSRRRTTPKSAAYRSPIPAHASGISRSLLTASSRLRRRRPMSAHPAFSKLFVQTESAARLGALLATRRKRSPDEPEIWVAHHAVVEGEVARHAGVRNRPRAVSRPRPRSACAHRGDGRPAPVEYGRTRARSGVRAALSRARACRGHGAHRVLDHASHPRAPACWT